ncbi:hypothetical protein Btru_075307 [Bulinus truncatus]|nr:hypothetical protein Btru_075307 [Bulinus truncatus]
MGWFESFPGFGERPRKPLTAQVKDFSLFSSSPHTCRQAATVGADLLVAPDLRNMEQKEIYIDAHFKEASSRNALFQHLTCLLNIESRNSLSSASSVRSKYPRILRVFRPLRITETLFFANLQNDHSHPLFHLWKSYWQQMGGIYWPSSSGVHRRTLWKDALDALGLKRYCCRRMLLSHVDLIEKLLNYAPLEKSDAK